MRRLHYAGGSIITSDIMCKAVLRYARAIAENGRYDILTVPSLGEDGRVSHAYLFLGPSSQLYSTPIPEGGIEPIDVELVQRLEERTQGLQPSRPEWTDELNDGAGDAVLDGP